LGRLEWKCSVQFEKFEEEKARQKEIKDEIARKRQLTSDNEVQVVVLNLKALHLYLLLMLWTPFIMFLPHLSLTNNLKIRRTLKTIFHLPPTLLALNQLTFNPP
jgi:hypothetical protein